MFDRNTTEAPNRLQRSATGYAPDPATEIGRAIIYLQSALVDLRTSHPESAATYLLEARRHTDRAFDALIPSAPSE